MGNFKSDLNEERQPILSTRSQENRVSISINNDIRSPIGDLNTATPSNHCDKRCQTQNSVYKREHNLPSDVVNVTRVPFSHTTGHSGILTTDRGLDSREHEKQALACRLQYHSRLDPRPNSSLAMPDHVVPIDFMVYIYLPVRGKQSSFVTVFSLWNTMMGTSLLSMPWAIYQMLLQAGFITGILLLIAVAFLMFYTSYLILTSVSLDEGCKFLDFSDVCKHYLGDYASFTARLSSMAILLGAGIVYWILLSNFLYHIVVFTYQMLMLFCLCLRRRLTDYIQQSAKAVFAEKILNAFWATMYDEIRHTLTNHSDPLLNSSYPDANHRIASTFDRLWTEDCTVPVVLAFILILLVNFKSVVVFTKVNSFGIASVFFLIVYTVYKAFLWGIHFHTDPLWHATDDDYIPGFKWTFPALTGIASLAYFSHNCVITITSNQQNPENNVRDLSLAYMLTAMSYVIIGSVMTMVFPLAKHCIQDNFLNNMTSTDVSAFVANIMLFLQMICVFPLLVFIFRVQLMVSIFHRAWPSWRHVFGMNLVFFSICILFAVFLPHIGKIIGFVGALCSVVYAITLPCLVHIVARHRNGQLSRTYLITHTVLIGLGAINFISQFLILD